MDAVVSVVGTRYSINALNLKVIRPWHPWSESTKVVCFYLFIYFFLKCFFPLDGQFGCLENKERGREKRLESY